MNRPCVTAIANDYAFEIVFARQIEALGGPGDLAFGISTSGTRRTSSPGCGRPGSAVWTPSPSRGAPVVRCASGRACVRIPADDTPRIQEGHVAVAHILCEIAEREIAGPDSS